MLHLARKRWFQSSKSRFAVFVLAVMLIASMVIGYLANNRVDAAANSTINFQARLMNATGSIAPDGNYNIEFKLYNLQTSSGSSQGSCTGDSACLWTETYTSTHQITVANGYVNVSLGSLTAFPSTINWDQQLWLTMRVGGTSGTPSWDAEMSPRLQLTAVPYAFRAGQLAQQFGSNEATLQFASGIGQATTVNLPDPGTSTPVSLCYQNAVNNNCLSSSSGVQLQASTPGTQQTGFFNISGTGIAGTSFLTLAVDTPTAGNALSIGTSHATSITVGSASSTSTLQGVTKISTLGSVSANAATVCRDTSTTQLIACDATNTTGRPYLQGGNSFGTTGTLGTVDANNLQVITANTVRATFDQSNNLYLGNGTTASSPNNFNIFATGSSTSGTAGAALAIQGGTGLGTGVGGQLALQGGSGGAGAATAGGAVLIQGGTANGTGVSNGGNVTIQGGTAAGTGTEGLIQLNGSTYFTSGTFSSGSNGTITKSLIDSFSSIMATATASGLTFSMQSPTINTTPGRIMYITNNGTNAFVLSGLSNGTSFTLNAGSTATLIWQWNGTTGAWTSAGVDASTLQNVYNNSIGGTTPEILLDSTRNGIDIQDSNTTLGSTVPLLAVRASATATTLGTALFVVNDNGGTPLVGIGTGSNTPSRPLDIAVNNSTVNAPPELIEQAGTGDASLQFKTPAKSWTIGANSSNSSSFSINSSTAANTATVGSAGPGASTDSADQNAYSCSQFMAASTGTATSISIKIGSAAAASPNNNLSMAVYTGTSTQPTTLVASTSTGTATGNSINTLPISFTVNSGTVYWLCANNNSNSGTLSDWSYDVGSANSEWFENGQTFSNGWSSTISNGVGATGTFKYDIFVSYTPTGNFNSFTSSLFTLTDTGQLTLQNSTNSQSAFQVQNTAGNNLFNVDTNTPAVNIGSIGTTALASTVNIGTSSGATQTVNIGSTNGASATTIKSGTGGISLQGGTGTAVAISGASGSTLSIGNTGVANTIQIGNATTGAVIQGINIGTNTATSSTSNVNIGSTIAGLITLQGSGITQKITSNTDTIQTSSNNTNAFQVENNSASNNAVFGVDTQNNRTVLGTANSIAGSLLLNSGSGGTGSVTLTAPSTNSAYSLILPTTTPTTGLCLETSSASASQLVFSSCSNSNASITEVSESDNHGSATTVNTVTDSPTSIGDLIVVTAQIPSGNSITSISGGNVGSWTKVGTLAGDGTVNRVEMWMGTATATGAGTVTISSAGLGNNDEITATEYTAVGVNAGTTWGADTGGGNKSTGSATVTYASLTPQATGELYEGYAQVQRTPATAGATSGFTYKITGQTNVITYNTNVTAATAYQPTANQASSGEANTISAIFTAFVSSTAIDNSTTVQQANFNVQAGTSGSVAAVLQAATSGTTDILDVYGVGSVQNASDQVLSLSYQGNIQFGGLTAQTISVAAQQTANTAGVSLTVSGATGNGTGTGGALTVQAGTGGTSGAGGLLAIQGGSAGGGNANGGNVLIQGGAATGTGTGGSVIVKPQTNSTTAFQVQDAGSTNAEINVDTTVDTTTVATTNGGTNHTALVINSGTVGYSGLQLAQLNSSSATSSSFSQLLGVDSSGNIGLSSGSVSLTSPALAYWDGLNDPTITGNSYPQGTVQALGVNNFTPTFSSGNGEQLTNTTSTLGGQTAGHNETGDINWNFSQVPFEETQFQFKAGGGTGADGTWFYSYADGVPTTEYGAGGAFTKGYIIYFSEFHGCAGISYGGYTDGNQCNNGGGTSNAGTSPLKSVAVANIGNNTFHSVDVMILQNQITVRLDGVVILQYSDVYTRDTSNLNYGFGARTGGSTNNHYIKGLLVTKLGTNTTEYNINNINALTNNTANANTNMYWNNSAGALGINTNNPGAQLEVDTTAVGSVGQIIQGMSGQTADLLDVRSNGSTTVIDKIDSSGNLKIGTGSDGSSPELLELDGGTANPATEVDGAIFYNTNTDSFRCGQNGSWVACDGLVDSITSVSTLSNPTALTAFGQNYTVPAGDCQPGVTYQITAGGVFSSGSNYVLNIDLYKGGTGGTKLGGDPSGEFIGGTAGNWGWSMQANIVCDTNGTSGTIESQGTVIIGAPAGSSVYSFANTSTITWNTTTSNTIGVVANFGTSSASNNISLRQFIVTRLGP